MPLPPFHAFGLDVLTCLAVAPAGLRKGDLYEAIAAKRALTDADLSETLPSGGQSTFENRIGWICSWMKKVGWVGNPARNLWVVTDAGRARLAAGRALDLAELKGADAKVGKVDVPVPAEVATTPLERIHTALEEILDDVRASLLDRIGTSSPLFFERLVLKLLSKMGYAGKLGRAEHAGRSGDGGIDGILYLDRLELERVYVQAKRWSGSVGASVVRDFAGSMDAEGATKGVILTTSSYTQDARAYVQRSPKAIRLVDGRELARLLVEFEVGVTPAEKLVVPRIDEETFDESP